MKCDLCQGPVDLNWNDDKHQFQRDAGRKRSGCGLSVKNWISAATITGGSEDLKDFITHFHFLSLFFFL